MKTLLVVWLLILPGAAFAAADDCRVVEFSDHFEVVCEGDGTPVIPTSTLPGQPPGPAADQGAELKRSSVRAQPPEPARDASPPVELSRDGASQPPPSGAGATQRNRQGRPNAADLNAAIEARRKLIREQRPKE